MLVIDGVELVLFDQVLQVREFKRDHPALLQQRLGAADEIVEVRHVRQHVVAENEIGLAVRGFEFLGERYAKEIDRDRDAFALGDFGCVGRRLDAHDVGHAERREVLEQIAVIARDLDDEALVVQAAALGDHLAIAARVIDP